MYKIVALLTFLFSPSAYAGLAPWSNLPEQKKPIKLTKQFNKKHWLVQNIELAENTDETKTIKKIIKLMGVGDLFKYDHHAFVCYSNKSQYLYIYDSGWGPGYALVNKPFSYVRKCAETNKPLKLGSGLMLGMVRSEVEKIIENKSSKKVTDLVYEEIYDQKVPPNKICPIWHSVTLKIVFKENIVTGIYFDDHGEPNDSCKTI
jgi:hypothetical protein